MKEHEDRDMNKIEKSSVIVDSTAIEEIVTEEVKTEGVLSGRDEGEDMMVDVVGADPVDSDRKADSVRSVEECMQKETVPHDLNIDMKEEVAGSGSGSGEEDVCHDSVGTSVLTSEKVEVTVNEEGSKTSVEVRDCEMSYESRGEPQFGDVGVDVDVKDGKESTERRSTMELNVETVEECMQKETETRDLNMDIKEAAVSGEDDSVENRVLGSEKIEVTVIEKGLNASVEVSKDVVQGNVETCGSLVQDSKESSIGGGDFVVDNKDVTERGSTKEVVEQHVESVEEVADGDRVMDRKTKKEVEILDSSKTTTTNLGSQEVDMMVVEDGFVSKDEAKDCIFVDPSLVSANNQTSSTKLVNVGTDEVDVRSKEESLQPTIEVITDDSQGNESIKPRFDGGENDLIDKKEESERGLPKEIMEQPMECDQQVGVEDCMANEKIVKESEPLDSLKTSEPSTTTNPGSEDVDVVVVEEGLASKDEAQDGVSVDPSLVCADNRSLLTKVVDSATSEGDVIAQAENVDQQVEVIANDAQNLENGTGVGDTKSGVDPSNGEPRFGGETSVKDIEETEKGLTAEDGVMDEKTGKGDEVLDSAKIPESLTTADLGPEEVLTVKIEAQDSDSVGQRLVCPDNQSLSTENSDQRAEVDTMIKDESVHQTMEVAARTEVDQVTGFEKQKDLDSVSDGSEKKPSLHPDKEPMTNQSFKVGECIQRVASQLTGPPLESNRDPDGQHVDQLVKPENSQNERTIVESKQSPVADMLSQLHLVAQDPMKEYTFLNTIKPFFHDRRTSIGRPLSVRKRKTSNENESEEFEFEDVNDSYWTDRIVQNQPEEQSLQENQNRGQEQEHHVVAYEPDKPAKPNRRSNKKRFMFSNHEMGVKEQSELVERRRLNLATEVVLKFPEGIYFPSEIHLNKMFRRFGALMESETEVDRQNGRARVVFKKCCDAEVAHSSAGKFNIFGSINVNYELNYTPLVSYKPLLLSVLQDSMDAS